MSGMKFADSNNNLIFDAYQKFGKNMVEGQENGQTFHEILSNAKSMEIKNKIVSWSGGTVPKYEKKDGTRVDVDLTKPNHPVVKLENDEKGKKVGIVLSQDPPGDLNYLIPIVDEIAVLAVRDKVAARNMLYGIMILTRCM